jgi:hypothetical protein
MFVTSVSGSSEFDVVKKIEKIKSNSLMRQSPSRRGLVSGFPSAPEECERPEAQSDQRGGLGD